MRKLDKNLLKQNIELAAKRDLTQNNISGCCYWVMQGNETVYKNCFGTAPCSVASIKDDTLFRLASMTKPITAVAALLLVDKGLLRLDDPITKYLDEFKDIHITSLDENGSLADLGKATREITVKSLLSHTSGIECGGGKPQKMTAQDKRDVDSTVSFLAKSGLDFEPETHQNYSAFGAFDVMVKIIEKISGTDYLTFLKRDLFEPCGMTDTTFCPSAEQWGRMVPMHNKENGQNAVQKMPEGCIFEDFPCSHYLGGAGLASTLNDYSRFAKMLLSGGVGENGRIISEETLCLLNTPCVSADIMSGSERWGLGVRVICDSAYAPLPIGAYGWSGAYGGHFWIDPENRIAAVFLKNSRFDGGAGNASARAFEAAVCNSLTL